MTTGGDAPTAATVELLGVLAYGELSAFDRLAEDARAAPTLAGRAQLSTMAAAEIGHFRLIEDHLGRSGIAVADAMAPFVALIDSYHASTAPRSWLESLVKAYLGDGLGADFYREVAGWVDPGTGDLVQRVLADTGHSAFAEREVQAACAPPTRRSATGWPCGAGGCSARPSPTPSGSSPSATSWPSSSCSARERRAAWPDSSGRCRPRTAAGWAGSDSPESRPGGRGRGSPMLRPDLD